MTTSPHHPETRKVSVEPGRLKLQILHPPSPPPHPPDTSPHHPPRRRPPHPSRRHPHHHRLSGQRSLQRHRHDRRPLPGSPRLRPHQLHRRFRPPPGTHRDDPPVRPPHHVRRTHRPPPRRDHTALPPPPPRIP